MAPGAKPWPVLPAATLLLFAVILMAKHTAIAAVDSAPGGCSKSLLPESCTIALNIPRDLGADFVEACCRDLFKLKVVDNHQCAKCALLKEFDDGAIDLTKSCTNGVNTAAAKCKELCKRNPEDAECKFP